MNHPVINCPVNSTNRTFTTPNKLVRGSLYNVT